MTRGKGRVGSVAGRSQLRSVKDGLWDKPRPDPKFFELKKTGGSFSSVKRQRWEEDHPVLTRLRRWLFGARP